MTRFSCPACKTVLKATAEQAGKVIACPKCKKQMKVPGAMPSPAAAPARRSATLPAQPSSEGTFANHTELPALPSGSRRRQKAVGPALMMWGGLSIVLLIGTVLAVIYFSRSDTRITEAYFPRSPGPERFFVFREYRPDGSAVTTERAFHWKDEGVLEWWNKDNPKQRTVNSYRTHQGFVELRVVKQQQGDGEWEPFLKLGAKPGDTWDRNYKEKNYAESISFRYEEFKTHEQRPCIVIAYEMKGSNTTIKGQRWYVKGVGLVRDEAKILWDQSWKPYSEIVYAEWGGDSSAFAAEKPNPKQGDPATNKTAPPAETRPAESTPNQGATELTRLERKGFVIFYKGFSEEQMAELVDLLFKQGMGKEPRREFDYGLFSYQAKIAKSNQGMRIVRENEFTTIMVPVEPRLSKSSQHYAALVVGVLLNLHKIDESVRGKSVLSTCNNDWSEVYLTREKK